MISPNSKVANTSSTADNALVKLDTAGNKKISIKGHHSRNVVVDESTKTPASILQEAGKGPNQEKLSLSGVTAKLTFSGATKDKVIGTSKKNNATKFNISTNIPNNPLLPTSVVGSTATCATVANNNKLIDSPSAAVFTTKKTKGPTTSKRRKVDDSCDEENKNNPKSNDDTDDLEDAKRQLDFDSSAMTPKSTTRNNENNDDNGNSSNKKDSPIRTSPRLRSSAKKKSAASLKNNTPTEPKKLTKGAAKNTSVAIPAKVQMNVENTGPPMEKDDTVTVLSRTWPGVNKPGGAGRIWRVNDNGTYDIKYLLGGSERGVERQYITLTNLVSVAVERKRRPRTIYDPDTMEAVVPGEKEKQAEEERERRLKEKAEKAKQREAEKKIKEQQKKQRQIELAAEAEQKKLQLEAAAKKKKAELLLKKIKKAKEKKAKGKPGPKKGWKRKDSGKNGENSNVATVPKKKKSEKEESSKKNGEETKKSLDNKKEKKKKKKSKNDNNSNAENEEDNEDGNSPSTGRTSSRKQRADAGKKREKYAKRKQRDDINGGIMPVTTANKKARTRITQKIPSIRVNTRKEESETWNFATSAPKFRTDFPSVPSVDPTEWPATPEYILDSARYISTLTNATAIVAMRSAETPAPFIRPPAYPEGWTASSLSATMTPSYQNIISNIKSTVRDSYNVLGINTLTPLGHLKYKRCVRKLTNFRVEHDRLRVFFLESIRQCKRRYLCHRNGSLIPGAIKLLDIENNNMRRASSNTGRGNNTEILPVEEGAKADKNNTEKGEFNLKFENEIENIEYRFSEMKKDMLNRQQHELNIFLSSQWHKTAVNSVDRRNALNNLIADGWISRCAKRTTQHISNSMRDIDINAEKQQYDQNMIFVKFPYALKAKRSIEAL